MLETADLRQHCNTQHETYSELLQETCYSLIYTHGRTPAMFPANPAYKPFHSILLMPFAACGNQTMQPFTYASFLTNLCKGKAVFYLPGAWF
jgi:hypothetical protein